MKQTTFKASTGKWLVVGGLLLLMCITSAGKVLAVDLSDPEKDSLTLMREEEKLARDVYLFLYIKWGSPIFNNIANSEQTHMDAIKTLLFRYGITDPAADTGQGVFVNSDLQHLYDELITQGSVSLIEALEVGVLIEDTDIEDLKDGIILAQHKDIKTVYSNLLKGSLNHRRAFVSNLAIYEQ